MGFAREDVLCSADSTGKVNSRQLSELNFNFHSSGIALPPTYVWYIGFQGFIVGVPGLMSIVPSSLLARRIRGCSLVIVFGWILKLGLVSRFWDIYVWIFQFTIM